MNMQHRAGLLGITLAEALPWRFQAKERQKAHQSTIRTKVETQGLALDSRKPKKNGSFSLIERVILSAGAMLIFSVSFQIDQMPEGEV